MYVKLALGNVRRSLRDYSVYFATLALAACLLYSFIASGNYLLALDLTPDQRAIYAKSGTVLEGFSVFVVVIFIFLVAYANRFIVRRRKREFGLYALVGMPWGRGGSFARRSRGGRCLAGGGDNPWRPALARVQRHRRFRVRCAMAIPSELFARCRNLDSGLLRGHHRARCRCVRARRAASAAR